MLLYPICDIRRYQVSGEAACVASTVAITPSVKLGVFENMSLFLLTQCSITMPSFCIVAPVEARIARTPFLAYDVVFVCRTLGDRINDGLN
jgi:hypothetical protein